MNKYQELLQVLEKEHQITCKAADIEETDRAKAYFQLLKDFMDKETPIWIRPRSTSTILKASVKVG